MRHFHSSNFPICLTFTHLQNGLSVTRLHQFLCTCEILLANCFSAGWQKVKMSSINHQGHSLSNTSSRGLAGARETTIGTYRLLSAQWHVVCGPRLSLGSVRQLSRLHRRNRKLAACRLANSNPHHFESRQCLHLKFIFDKFRDIVIYSVMYICVCM